MGLPGDGLLRADQPLRHAGRLSASSSTRCTTRASASSSTGCRRTSRATTGRWPASTAPRSTSTTTRARARTRIGARSSSTTAATRCAISSSPTRCSGASGSTSTACGSTPWRRCSTSITRARPGEWIPNQYGGRENLEAIEFLREFNTVVYTEHPGVMTIAEESTAWPLVTRPPYHRRARLLPQVEHGLDARHARLLRARSGPPPLPPERSDLRDALSRSREFHAAALARRGGARQGLAARQDAGRRLAEVRQSAGAATRGCGPSRQEAAVHGRRARASGASGTWKSALDWHLSGDPPPRRAGAGALAQPG